MNEYRLSKKLMGSAFELIVVHENAGEADRLLELGVREISRIEDLLSEFRENTATTLINQNAGIKGVEVEDEVFSLIQRCIHLSNITQGAFDITVGPLKKIYRFRNEDFRFPDEDTIKSCLEKTGYRKILLTPGKKEVFLSGAGMSISFAAIGKGYAADRVRKLWIKEGLRSGVVSASGDLTTLGTRADGSPWKIGIADPGNRDSALFFIPVNNASVATSGDYEQYFMHKGIRYSHNINPITGKPLSGTKSVSIISPAAELSDALATAVYIMGVDAGLHFINQLPDTYCIIIDDHNRTHYSKRTELHYAV
jgi:thiamine biosynthesis lipoprotein